MSSDSPEKGSSSSAILIVIAVIGLFVVLGVVVLAGMAYFRMQTARRAAFRAMVSTRAVFETTEKMPVETPNRSAQDGCEIFLRKLKAGEFADAYEQHTTRRFRQAQTLAQFRQLLNAHPALFAEAEITENQPEGHFTIKAKETARLEMTWEDGDWKVDCLSVP